MLRLPSPSHFAPRGRQIAAVVGLCLGLGGTMVLSLGTGDTWQLLRLPSTVTYTVAAEPEQTFRNDNSATNPAPATSKPLPTSPILPTVTDAAIRLVFTPGTHGVLHQNGRTLSGNYEFNLTQANPIYGRLEEGQIPTLSIDPYWEFLGWQIELVEVAQPYPYEWHPVETEMPEDAVLRPHPTLAAAKPSTAKIGDAATPSDANHQDQPGQSGTGRAPAADALTKSAIDDSDKDDDSSWKALISVANQDPEQLRMAEPLGPWQEDSVPSTFQLYRTEDLVKLRFLYQPHRVWRLTPRYRRQIQAPRAYVGITPVQDKRSSSQKARFPIVATGERTSTGQFLYGVWVSYWRRLLGPCV